MGPEVPEPFRMKDLFIDVKLEACVDGSSYDFLGRKLFSTEFFRKSIGFGITSINIEVNTSLQPLVVIVFKDLYGATIFGGQNRDSEDGGQSIDYSVLFNWPPPKFLFSFKGYLGRSASWVLNLKRTSTSFNASDGSYDLKCEFVPNQWGFFADIPFLYLLAAKRLRKDKIGPDASEERKKTITSVFDLIKIGRQVEVKTQDATKEFDDLVKQLGSIKSNISRSISVSNIIRYEDVIDGVVNNRPVKDFVKMKMPKLSEIHHYNTNEIVEQNLGNATELSKMNTIMLLSIGFEVVKGSGIFKDGFTTFGVTPLMVRKDPNNPQVVSAKNQTLGLISENLRKIDDEIKRLVFDSSEKKLEKITIGEIFSQLAKDAAFIMGSILDAGLDGYRGDEESGESSRRALRDSRSNELIGQAFPMFINDKGEEVPATTLNFGSDIGVDSHEMDFVRSFIRSISEGVARDLISKTDGGAGHDDSKLKQRINNMEMTSNNPYKPFYSNIATNILVRGGIVGYLTRSNDPNLPGDYGRFTIDRDGRQEIEEIAVRDAQNISASIITSLSDVDALLLKRFCTFMTRFYDVNGEEIIDSKGKGLWKIGDPERDSSHKVVMSSGGDGRSDETLDFKTLWKELRQPSMLNGIKLNDGKLIWDEVEVGNNSSSAQSSKGGAENPLSLVGEDYTSTKITNNGLAYFYPDPENSANKFFTVVFRGNKNKLAQEANTSPTDAEYKNSNKDKTDWYGQDSPLGYIPINSIKGDDGNDLGRIKALKYNIGGAAESSLVYDADKLMNPNPGFYGVTESSVPGNNSALYQVPVGGTLVDYFMYNKQVVQDKFEADNLSSGSGDDEVDFAGNIGFTVCAHQSTGKQGALVFGLFEPYEGWNQEGRSQRIFIRKICEVLLSEINNIENERNQVIGSILGKAGEQEDAIYKQMHTLYHQWQSLSYSSNKIVKGSLCGDSGEFKGGDGGSDGKVFGVAEALEKKYGGNHTNISSGEFVKITNEDGEEKMLSLTDRVQSNGVPDGTFIYDYPLQRIRPQAEIVQVRDSIINLDSLYNPNGNTTVLNIIQQVCTKNNFLFVPIPGNPDYLNVKSIYSVSPEPASLDVKNFFHVLFTPTPESRSKTRNKDGTHLALESNQKNYTAHSFAIKYGHPDNQIVSNISVGTDDTKVTAESIINLQRLVDNDNQNKKVTTDCSMLPVLAGRSYKASVDMLGNAQVYPMQFFYLENSPLFGGLYQIMKVKHDISPNDFKTSIEGMRMRFSPGDGYGAVKPITLDTFRSLGGLEAPLAVSDNHDADMREKINNISNIVVGDNNPVGNYTKDRIEAAVKASGHKWFDEKGDYELNIVGIRNSTTGSLVTNVFDDFITVSYKENGNWKFWSWPATTQPGKSYVESPLSDSGTAILKPGQYIDSHTIRKHAGSYDALGQDGKVTVFRDDNKDLNYDLLENTLQTGFFGVNLHRSSPTGTSTYINKWSAGCQVFSTIGDFEQFMKIVRTAESKHGNKFTYTLIESSNIPGGIASSPQSSSGDYDNIIKELEAGLNIE